MPPTGASWDHHSNQEPSNPCLRVGLAGGKQDYVLENVPSPNIEPTPSFFPAASGSLVWIIINYNPPPPKLMLQ